MLVLDAGAVSALAQRSLVVYELIDVLHAKGEWPPVVPAAVLVECLQGHAGHDANTNRFLKTCDIREGLSEALARRAAWLRRRAGRGSAVDAIVVAIAEPDGIVLTSDLDDIRALAAHALDVSVEGI